MFDASARSAKEQNRLKTLGIIIYKEIRRALTPGVLKTPICPTGTSDPALQNLNAAAATTSAPPLPSSPSVLDVDDMPSLDNRLPSLVEQPRLVLDSGLFGSPQSRSGSPSELPSLPGSPQLQNDNVYFRDLIEPPDIENEVLLGILDDQFQNRLDDDDKNNENLGLPPGDGTDNNDDPDQLNAQDFYDMLQAGLDEDLENDEDDPDNPIMPLDNAAFPAFNDRIPFATWLDTKDLVTTFTLCPKCQKRYLPTQIASSDNPQCVSEGCMGELYTNMVLSTGKTQRKPVRTFPYASLTSWLRRMLAQDGLAKLTQAWRKPHDQRPGPPISKEEWARNVDGTQPLEDITDGFGWRARAAGVNRIIDPNTGTATDQNMVDPPLRFSSLPFGLSLSMNVDWFQSNKEGSYSVGAVYFIINNLPRHLRFLCENMCLVMVMPGPNEPNNYALDQMMEPLVDEILKLQQGVRMSIWNSETQDFHEQVVHGSLHNLIADLMARIKMGGAAGVASEMNFYFPYRLPSEELDNKVFWQKLETAEERQAFAEFTGTRFTALDRLGDWHAALCSPPDAMHLIHLGAINWIVKQILFAPGMFNKRPGAAHNPVKKFNDALARVWLPYNIGRLPPKLGQTSKRVKAEQWKTLIQVLAMVLFEAWREGDDIPDESIPRG
ncbi:Transposase family tnp2 [Ceratobasidium sp. AG-Ba]|nr:Transposase family tnp2 [Ceratobasidium sp. AG-Ba]